MPDAERCAFIEQLVPADEVAFFQKKAEQKIEAEGWNGRNKKQKVENFVNCWVTEEAFKGVLIKYKAFFRHRALYVGDAAGAGVDFEVKVGGKWMGVGIRSINDDSFYRWKSVAYPEDRFLHEKEKIPDHVVVCHNEKGVVQFIGMIDKEMLLSELDKAERRKSTLNQEWFRKVPLEKFDYGKLVDFLGKLDKR